MIGFIIRIILAVSLLAFNVYLFAVGSWGWGISFILITALVWVSFWRNERVIMSLYHMRMGNNDKAWKSLSKITAPQFLPKGQHAYVLYLKGMLGLQQGLNFTECEQMIRKALIVGLRTKQDQAVAHMQLAGICAQTGRKNEAKILLSQSKKLDEKNMLKDQLRDLGNQLNMIPSQNQMRMAQMHKGRVKTPRKR